MSWLSSFLHPGRAYKKGQHELENYYNQAQGFQQPYMQHGQEAYGGLSEAMKSLLDPQALQNKWMSGYQESEAAKNAEQMAQEHGLNAASAMGLMGSSPALNAIQSGTSRIGAEDRQQYLNDLMQKYLSGAGLAQGIYGTGANAANQASNNAMNMGQNASQMTYHQNQAGGNMFGGLLGLGGSILGSALGGPIGGALAQRWNLMGK
jgi:hypothetical protein